MASRLPMSVQTDTCLQIIKHVWLDEAKGKNFVFSPFSLYAALSLLAPGSNGETLEQILSFLNSTSLDHLKSVASQLIDLVDGTNEIKEGDGGAGLNLSFVSGIWIDDSCTLKRRFKKIAKSIYKAEAEAVDFKTKADEVRKTVNKWVEEETNGLVKDLIPNGFIDHTTRLVLANALYFKGEWKHEFDSSKTKNSSFYLLDRSSVQVPFMSKNRSRQFLSCFNGFSVLQVPYKQQSSDDDPHQRDLSMYIFLPDKQDGLGGLIEKVSSDPGFIDRHLPNGEVLVSVLRIPKFKILFGFEASSVLKNLGLVLPFDEVKAEFKKMVRRDGRDQLSVSSVHHKCFVEVDEVGTEAAAATAISVASYCCRPPKMSRGIDFIADHPFMFIIRDNLSGMALFIGHVLDPSSKK